MPPEKLPVPAPKPEQRPPPLERARKKLKEWSARGKKWLEEQYTRITKGKPKDVRDVLEAIEEAPEIEGQLVREEVTSILDDAVDRQPSALRKDQATPDLLSRTETISQNFNLDLYPPRTKAVLIRDEAQTTQSVAALRSMSTDLSTKVAGGEKISEAQFIQLQREFASHYSGVSSLLSVHNGEEALQGLDGGWFTPTTLQNIREAITIYDDFVGTRAKLFPAESGDEFSELSFGLGSVVSQKDLSSREQRYAQANAELPTTQDLLFHTLSNPDAVIASTIFGSYQAQVDHFGKAHRNTSREKSDNVERYPLFFSGTKPVNNEPLLVFSKRDLLSKSQVSCGSRDIALYHKDYQPGDTNTPGFEVDLLKDPFMLVIQGDPANDQSIKDTYKGRFRESQELQRRQHEEGLTIDPDKYIDEHIMIVKDYSDDEMRRVQQQLFARNQIPELKPGSFIPSGVKPGDIDPGKDLGYLYEYRQEDFKYFADSPPHPEEFDNPKDWIHDLAVGSPTLKTLFDYQLGPDLTVGDHTADVVDLHKQFYEPDPFFENAVLTLHDVGKGYAKTGDALVDEQHNFTAVITQDVLKELGYPPQQVELAVTLVRQDIIGELITHHLDVDQAAERIKIEAHKAGLPVKEFYSLLDKYYKVDAGYYVKKGYPFFNDVLDFNEAERKIKYKGDAAKAIENLQSSLQILQ